MTGNAAATHETAALDDGADTSKDTRQRLLDAATEEFCVYGQKGASTARIVAAAGCNIRMLYHYFGNKDGLYRAALLQVYDDLRAAENRQRFWSEDPISGILGLAYFTFDYMHENRQFPRMILAENMVGGTTVTAVREPYEGSRMLIENLDALIAQGHASGQFARKPDALDLYLTILALSFIHISNRHTLATTFGRDLQSPEFIATRRTHAAEVVLGYLGVTNDAASGRTVRAEPD